MASSEDKRRAVGLPTRHFLYTLDQIGTLISVSLITLKKSYIHFHGEDAGVPARDRMQARDIGPKHSPDWRVEEAELIRWLKHKGFRIYE